MEKKKLLDKGNYSVDFDPLKYLCERFTADWSTLALSNGDRDKLLFPLQCYHEFFCLPEIRRSKSLTLLDFGCGPSIQPLISAAPHLESIVLADYSVANRAYLQKWIKDDHDTVQAFDWNPQFNYVVRNLERQQDSNAVQDKVQLVRQSIKDVVSCDITRDSSIIERGYEGPYDIVHCKLTLCVTAQSPDAYKAQLIKLGRLVKPGGRLLFLEAERKMNGEYEYPHADHSWEFLGVTREFVAEAIQEAGFADIYEKTVGPADKTLNRSYMFFSGIKVK